MAAIDWRKTGQELIETLRTPYGITASGAGELFAAVFGRDSLITLLILIDAQKLIPDDRAFADWVHGLGVSILKGLASLQGKETIEYNEEQPGKIVHEYWSPIPERLRRAGWPMISGRYYGTVDATFLYLIALEAMVTTFADDALLEDLWHSAEAAFSWILKESDHDGDGRIEYMRRNPDGRGLTHMVWKDSSDSVLLSGDLPVPQPIAWIEVQGYGIAALRAMQTLAARHAMLSQDMQAEIHIRTQGLTNGLTAYWMSEESFPCIALDSTKQQVRAVASNPGHLLWSQAVDKKTARAISTRLLKPDMHTKWGVRTLSEQCYYYNPLGYHNGTIWPFDTALLVIGMRKYGHNQAALRIAKSVLRGIDAFQHPVEQYSVLPTAKVKEPHIAQKYILMDSQQFCTVQAWTVASLIYFSVLMTTTETPETI